MIGIIIKSELKNVLRDKLYWFFAIYPVILGVIGYYLIPYIAESSILWSNVVAMIFIVLSGFIFGALLAFTLLDDKDDNVLMSLKITPISVRAYIGVKLALGFIFGFIATMVIIFATGFLGDVSLGMTILISILGALQAPSITLIVNSFADNKVEGFVYMKMSGLLVMIPAIGFFVNKAIQYLFGIVPGFWASRLIEHQVTSDTINGVFLFFVIGVAYNLLFTYFFMKIYFKRSNL